MVMRVCKVNESQKQIIKGSVIVSIDGNHYNILIVINYINFVSKYKIFVLCFHQTIYL